MSSPVPPRVHLALIAGFVLLLAGNAVVFQRVSSKLSDMEIAVSELKELQASTTGSISENGVETLDHRRRDTAGASASQQDVAAAQGAATARLVQAKAKLQSSCRCVRHGS